ncbi:MAG TPA: hypothetical protein VNW46_12755 [Gemmatimonadaceae bacterium]|jgi:hypothetical protein|nr:hypothetical protein [Gemmatimonadaceae bacterium]
MERAEDVTWRNERERGPADPVVRAAVDNVARNLAALSASEVVQLVLYPEPLAAWADGAGVDESQVANLFRRHRIYSRVRQLLADRLGVPLGILAHLVDASPAPPAHQRPAIHAEVMRAAGLPIAEERPAIDWRTTPYPSYREGTNPLERLALANLAAGAASMPSSRVVGYALWPESLAGFAARSGRFTLGQLLTTLSGLRRADYIETALARRLQLSRAALERFIASSKRDPFAPAAVG